MIFRLFSLFSTKKGKKTMKFTKKVKNYINYKLITPYINYVWEDMQYKRGCAIESGTSSVQAMMCSTNEVHLQYKRGCAVQIRHTISLSEDVQYKEVNQYVWYRGHYSKIISNE